jgi:cell division protein FtsW
VGQAFINMGGVVGLVPITGVTLPLISAGGSSLVLTMFVIGMLASFARTEPEAVAALHARGRTKWSRLLGLPLPPKPPAKRAPRGPRPDAPVKTGARASAARAGAPVPRQRHGGTDGRAS